MRRRWQSLLAVRTDCFGLRVCPLSFSSLLRPLLFDSPAAQREILGIVTAHAIGHFTWESSGVVFRFYTLEWEESQCGGECGLND